MKTFTKLMVLLTVMAFNFTFLNAQDPAFVWDKSELTTAWADAGPASVVKEANGIKFEQIGTIGEANTYIRVNHSNNIDNKISLNSTSDALTISSTIENISKIVVTYSSNGANSTSNPYVGFHSAVSPMGSAEAVVSSCIVTAGIKGNTGVPETFIAPPNTKFVVLVRGLSCDGVTSDSREFRVFRIEVYTEVKQPIITSFAVNGVNATIDQTAKTIKAELPFGTNLTSLIPTVTLGGTATSYSPTGAVNFTNPVTFAAIGTGGPTNYTTTITTSTVADTDNTLKDLQVDGVTVAGFNAETLTYSIEYPFTHVGIPVVSAEKNSVNATIAMTQASTFPGTATVSVTAQSGAKRDYTINFIQKAVSSACDITSLSINGRIGVISETNKTVIVKLPLETDITALTPTVKVSDLATYSPDNAQNFTNPVTYTITAEDGTTKTYTVSVELVNTVFNGPFPYETNFPTGYVIPDWMSSSVGAISFNDPYGAGSSGSDKVLWYDNADETASQTATVVRISGGNPIELHLSNCSKITAGLSSTGTRTYRLYVNDELKASSSSTTRDTKVTLTYDVNSTSPVVIKIKSDETNSAITLGYLKIEGITSELKHIQLTNVYFDGKTIFNENKQNLQVFDSVGRFITSSNENIDMSSYSKGLYIVKGKSGVMKIALSK